MYCDFIEAVAGLNLKASVNLDKLYEEFCVIIPALPLFLNDESQQILPARDRWCQIVNRYIGFDVFEMYPS